MSDERIVLKREFLLRDAEGRNVDVVAKLRSLSGQSPMFSVTCQNGAAHDFIAASAPEDVQADLQALIQVHLCDESGVPHAAAENAAYFLADAKFETAAKTLHDVIPVQDLYLVFGECARRLEDPATLQAHLDRVKSIAGVAARAIQRERDSSLGMRWKATKEAIEKAASLLLLRTATDAEVALWAEGKFSEKIKESLRQPLRRGIFKDAVSALVAERCVGVWKERADKAKEVLAKPDYRLEGRPPIATDPTTFSGFAVKYGLELASITNKRPEGDISGKYRWDCLLVGNVWRQSDSDLKKSLNSLVLSFTPSAGSEPTLEVILEHMQMEFADVTTHTCDEFVDEFEFTGSAKQLRKGQDIYYALTEQLIRFKRILGEGDEINHETGLSAGDLAFQEYVTQVGDNPPLTKDFFEEANAPSASPSP